MKGISFMGKISCFLIYRRQKGFVDDVENVIFEYFSRFELEFLIGCEFNIHRVKTIEER